MLKLRRLYRTPFRFSSSEGDNELLVTRFWKRRKEVARNDTEIRENRVMTERLYDTDDEILTEIFQDDTNDDYSRILTHFKKHPIYGKGEFKRARTNQVGRALQKRE